MNQQKVRQRKLQFKQKLKEAKAEKELKSNSKFFILAFIALTLSLSIYVVYDFLKLLNN